LKIILIVAVLLTVAGLWKIFQKAGVQPVLSVIPGVNLLFLIWKVAKFHIFYFVFYGVVAWISFGANSSPSMQQIMAVIAILLWVALSMETARHFGKSVLWGILAGILPFVFYPVLGFGPGEYRSETRRLEFYDNFEFYIAGVFILVTVALTSFTVFTRYCLRFTLVWNQEVSTGCFVWTIFLAAAGGFRKKGLMGVDIVVQLIRGKARASVELCNSIVLLVICSAMSWLSLGYVLRSTKITSALEISYDYINVSIVISFTLMTLYSLMFFWNSLKILLGKGGDA
jgi:TRAP-type C4-dicarboxylate transport system permease small subunit